MIYNRSDIEALPQRQRAALINSLPGYKPAVLVGTTNEMGQSNLAIINSCFHVGAAPPLLGMIIRPAPESTERHTLENILETGWYTLNALTANLSRQGHHTSARFPRDQSEFEACSITPQWIPSINAPFVSESPVKIGMKLAEHHPMEINGTQLIIGSVETIEVNEGAVREDGSVDLQKLDVVTVVGLDSYHSVNQGQRYAYAKPDREPSLIK